MEVIVPDDQLSLAIGKRGQNVRLASRLTNWRIDVKGESRYERQKQAGYQALLRIRGLGEEVADRLYESGIVSLEDFLDAVVADLVLITRFSEETVLAMMDEAAELLQDAPEEEAEAEETEETEEAEEAGDGAEDAEAGTEDEAPAEEEMESTTAEDSSADGAPDEPVQG
jgi:N utilization substance protein A